MKAILTALLIIASFVAKAQTYVTIPDPNFVSWLQMNYSSCMNGNQMDITCAAITSATDVQVQSQNITDLTGIEHFTGLTSLNCSYNYITTIPAISANIQTFDCSINQLTSLPALPAGLETLNCSNNNLGSLPNLPASLENLFCEVDNLTSLPPLPGTLRWLVCTGNNLTSLPNLPSSLRILYCSNNNFTTLPVLPTLLTDLECRFAGLTSLPSLPAGLTLLNCQNNNLSGLPPLPAGLKTLLSNNNNIHCFPRFPNTLVNPSFFSISGNPFTCLPNYVAAMNAQTLAYPLCMDGDIANNPNGCTGAAGITGTTFKDLNGDCIKNGGDNNIMSIPLKLYDNSNNFIGQTYSAQNGVYQFVVPPGTYMVKREVAAMPYTYLCTNPGLSSSVTVTGGNPLVSNVNFDIACLPNFDIGTLSVLPTGWVFPGEQHSVQVVAGDVNQWYNLNCLTGLAGQVIITVNGPVTYNGITPGALTPSISGNTYTYTIGDFGSVNIQNAFGLLFTTHTTAQAGDAICVTVSVTPVSGDNNPGNNYYQFCYTTVNSYDPNLKEVYPENVLPGFDDWLTYTIHFQNTGTAPAFNIRVQDILDSNLNLQTFEVLNFSHFNRTTLTGDTVNFSFPDIMLPDSTSDYDGSQGFISYRIKPKPALPAGTNINNYVSIYFDYNAPIVTNTVVTAFANPCPSENTLITAGVTGSSYQWQVNTGSGFTDISESTNYAGTQGPNLNIHNPPSSWYGYQYRCAVDGSFGDTTTLKFVLRWTGAANNQWENPLNWSCGTVPDGNTDVVIENDFGNPPTLNSNTSCRSLSVSPGVTFTVTTGFTLNIMY